MILSPANVARAREYDLRALLRAGFLRGDRRFFVRLFAILTLLLVVVFVVLGAARLVVRRLVVVVRRFARRFGFNFFDTVFLARFFFLGFMSKISCIILLSLRSLPGFFLQLSIALSVCFFSYLLAILVCF